MEIINPSVWCFAASQCKSNAQGGYQAYAIGGQRNPPASGCSNAAKTFDWVSGTGQHTPFGGYVPWGTGQPSNCFQQKKESCVQPFSDANTWNNYPCDIQGCSICWIP